ncbi:hypothetical protein J437_LFUL018865 [Ladona fulva]|uniref:Integrase catalytic domain-containing protein n=1 Tax=Ladona fulva TaxID=123851 RepID=A0A8K0PBQ2_LADFU|nr:hypothetical protein J437_LFUL018865 [Ladona fulva]
MSDVFKRTCRALGVKKINTTAYHLQTNGALERSHRTLVEYLRHFISEDQSNWDDWIPYAIFVYNTTPHTATGFTPHELMFGRKANIPGAMQKESDEPSYSYDDFVKELQGRMRHSQKKTKNMLISAKERNKRNYDKTVHHQLFQVKDKVLLFDETVRRGRSKKLSSQWVGPYVVVAVNGVNVTTMKKGKEMRVHANRLKLFL